VVLGLLDKENNYDKTKTVTGVLGPWTNTSKINGFEEKSFL